SLTKEFLVKRVRFLKVGLCTTDFDLLFDSFEQDVGLEVCRFAYNVLCKFDEAWPHASSGADGVFPSRQNIHDRLYVSVFEPSLSKTPKNAVHLPCFFLVQSLWDFRCEVLHCWNSKRL